MATTLSARRAKNFKPPLERFYPHLLFILVGYFAADISVLSLRDRMLPDQAPPKRAPKNFVNEQIQRGAYNTIISRNIFSADGNIPDTLASKKETGDGKPKIEIPIPSSLPLNLIGTIVHSNPDHSIAAIEVKSKNVTIPFSPGKDIEKMGVLTKVERRRAILRNAMTGHLEYIEIKDPNKLSINVKAPVAKQDNSAEIKEVSPDKFEISRAEILKATQNMSSLLMQAASTPHKKSNGEIDGFTIHNIQPGSIFTKLGIMNGDTIKGVNGEAVDSPAKALEFWNTLKNADNVKITVERDGREAIKDYSIK